MPFGGSGAAFIATQHGLSRYCSACTPGGAVPAGDKSMRKSVHLIQIMAKLMQRHEKERNRWE